MPTRNAILVWPWRFAFANRAQLCADLSRLLLGLAFIELITMPITQHFWTWDHFLQGGQDFELGLFIIVTCLCLVLLRAQHCRQKIRHLLAFCRFFSLPFRRSVLRPPIAPPCITAAAPRDLFLRRPAGAFLGPLQI
ncbi:MAG: hypothetical protein WB622_16335 [Acidobacteriaceae bacterium]|jgi:hypothetical protein